jgi:hypothetical protein
MGDGSISADRPYSAEPVADLGDVVPLRTFRTLKGDDKPDRALTWTSPAQRNRILNRWRSAIFVAFGDQARCMRVAWVLSDLFHTKKGFAFASDPYLAKQTGLPVNKVQESLTKLDRGGGIIRAHALANGKSQRRIFPSLPPGSGGGDTPRQPGGQNLSTSPRHRTPRTQFDMARLAARRREEQE